MKYKISISAIVFILSTVSIRSISHAQYCWRGDNTLAAMHSAVATVLRQPSESYLVFVVSDANVEQYGITPYAISQVMQSDPRVQMYCIFIATMGEGGTEELVSGLPSGRAFECFDLISRIFLFLSSSPLLMVGKAPPKSDNSCV